MIELFQYEKFNELSMKLRNELDSIGIPFMPKGYPIFPTEMILTEIPDEILPFERRNQCKDKKKTVLSFFEDDKYLFRRLKKLDKDNEVCREYMGVIGFDLSPRIGWDIEYQIQNLYMNSLVNAYRASQGIKILPNFRTGELSTMDILSIYPPNINYAVGTLGCAKRDTELNSFLLNAKLIYTRPNQLFIYGTLRSEYQKILEEFKVPYKVYKDYRKRSYEQSKQKERNNYGC